MRERKSKRTKKNGKREVFVEDSRASLIHTRRIGWLFPCLTVQRYPTPTRPKFNPSILEGYRHFDCRDCHCHHHWAAVAISIRLAKALVFIETNKIFNYRLGRKGHMPFLTTHDSIRGRRDHQCKHRSLQGRTVKIQTMKRQCSNLWRSGRSEVGRETQVW